MKRIVIILLLFTTSLTQSAQEVIHTYDQHFERAYSLYPEVPLGLLEAVAFTNTRIHNITSENTNKSCAGLPQYYGVMGLVKDGKNYFRSNLVKVSLLSGYSIEEIIASPEKNILAYAAAWSWASRYLGMSIASHENHMVMLQLLSELPDNGSTDFAMSSNLYCVLSFMNDPVYQKEFGFPAPHYNMEELFGKENLSVLSSSKVIINGNLVRSKNGTVFNPLATQSCQDYPMANWNPADSSNFSSRNTTAITAVVIHDIEGSYAGAISWFQNPLSNVSAHYILRSSDGQITQMVCEDDKGWHVGTENPYTIGLEHEGFAAQPSWYTPVMMQASANLVKDICNDYNINPLRTFDGPATVGQNVLGGCIKVKGHQHYPNQTHVDPGVYWDWEYYYQLINNNPSITTETTASGNVYDTGGPTGEYGDDERYLVSIEPPGADTLMLIVNSFDLEVDWDYLYIYDNSQPLNPLIGVYTGTIISDTFITEGKLLLEFRSDCATTAPGWNMSWNSWPIPNTTVSENNPKFNIIAFPNPVCDNVTVHYDLMIKKENVMATLYDVTGRAILQKAVYKSPFSFDLVNAIPGMYFLSLVTANRKETLKLIKQ